MEEAIEETENQERVRTRYAKNVGRSPEGSIQSADWGWNRSAPRRDYRLGQHTDFQLICLVYGTRDEYTCDTKSWYAWYAWYAWRKASTEEETDNRWFIER